MNEVPTMDDRGEQGGVATEAAGQRGTRTRKVNPAEAHASGRQPANNSNGGRSTTRRKQPARRTPRKPQAAETPALSAVEPELGELKRHADAVKVQFQETEQLLHTTRQQSRQ